MVKYQGISTLEVLVEAKNYNKWISDTIKSHIVFPALEVGAGTGNLTAFFLDNGKLHITDNDPGLVSHLKKRFAKNKKITINVLDINKKPPKKYDSFFSTIYAINVLEHIKDDDMALTNLRSMLKKNGKLILLVPAKKIAYSKLDRELGHFRRYEKDELHSKLENNGFKVDKLHFFNIVGLISWYVRDKVNNKSIHLKPYHIALFDSIVPILRIIESKITIPVGISLIAVAKKKS